MTGTRSAHADAAEMAIPPDATPVALTTISITWRSALYDRNTDPSLFLYVCVFFTGTRIATPLAYEARYVSISSVENMAPSNTYQSISDTQLQAHHAPLAPHPWDRRYTIVAAVDQHTAERCGGLLGPTDVFLPFARPGMGPPRLPGLVYRYVNSRGREGQCTALEQVVPRGIAPLLRRTTCPFVLWDLHCGLCFDVMLLCAQGDSEPLPRDRRAGRVGRLPAERVRRRQCRVLWRRALEA